MYYHMYGSGIGSLNVSTQDQDLWSLVGEQGNRWQQAIVSQSIFDVSDVRLD